MSCIPGEGPAKGMHQGKGRNILAQQGNKHMDSHLLSDNEVTLHACPEANSSLPFCLLTKNGWPICCANRSASWMEDLGRAP